MKKFRFLFSIILVILFTFTGTAAAAAPPERVKVIIGFDRAPGQSEEALVRGFGGEVKYTYSMIPAIAASVPETAIQGLLRSPRVTVIEPDVQVNMVADSYPWGVVQVGADAVHSSGVKGQGVKVAIIDTGIDYNHPDFNNVHYMGGYDFVNNDTDPMDDNGHGTHVAGIIAAAINNLGIVGIAPEVEVYALKVLNNKGDGFYSDIIAAVQWATGGSSLPGSVKVDITNNSYGSSGDPGSLVAGAFWLSYYQDGVLNVAAAGNTGTSDVTADNVIYPAAYDSAVAVAATDQNNDRAYFSSTGPKVELTAPGLSILSTYPGETYAYKSGTSMASPHAAGVAALIMSSPETVARDANNDGTYETNGDNTWTNEEVRQLLQATALDLGGPGRDTQYGYGLVDAAAAVLVSEDPNNPPDALDDTYSTDEDTVLEVTAPGLLTNDNDPDGNPITAVLVNNPDNGTLALNAHGSFIYTPDLNFFGTDSFTYAASDGNAVSNEATVTITVKGVNDPPVADAGSDQTVADGETVTFDGSGSYDIDDITLTYEWDFSDDQSKSGVTTTHTYASPGVYTATLTVTDDDGAKSSDSMVVTVNEVVIIEMHVDDIEMGSTIAGANTAATATVTIHDADGHAVVGATVYGIWSGATSDGDSGVTNGAGQVTFISDTVKIKRKDPARTFTFTIDDVVASGYIYDYAKAINSIDL